MRKLMFLVALSILGAAQAKATTCVMGTLTSYEGLIGGCTLGSLTFTAFGPGTGGGISGTASGPTANTLDLTPVFGPDGWGFTIAIASPGTWMASPGGAADFELAFEVSCTNGLACLNDVYSGITGSATGGGFDLLTETYCVGGTGNPTAPCPPPSGGSPTQDTLYVTSAGNTSNNPSTDMFSPVTQITVNKDMGAFGNDQGMGGPQGSATITSVIDEFSTTNSTPPPPVPEPSALLMLGSGLLGLALLSVRRRRIV